MENFGLENPPAEAEGSVTAEVALSVTKDAAGIFQNHLVTSCCKYI